jgi:regulator of replication initiation timing
VLQEELEDANEHQKTYYEALMQKEEQLSRLKSQCGSLQKAVEKLSYENELNELRNNPVEV